MRLLLFLGAAAVANIVALEIEKKTGLVVVVAVEWSHTSNSIEVEERQLCR